MTPVIARAEEALTLDSVLTAIAKVVAEKVKEQNATRIVVNPITDTRILNHTAGTGLTGKLIEKLRAEGLESALKTDLVFTGDDSRGEAESAGQRLGFAVGRLAFKVEHATTGRSWWTPSRTPPDDRQPRVTNLGDIARMGGPTIALLPGLMVDEHNKAVLDALDS